MAKDQGMSDTLLQPESVTAQAAASQLELQLGLAASSLAGVLLDFVDRLGAGLSVKDVTSGRYLHANLAMAEVFGRRPNDLVGQRDADVCASAVWGGIRSADQFAATQTAAQVNQHRLEFPEGTREFTVTRVRLGRLEPGAAPLLCSIWMEQTAQRQRELQLVQALKQIERLSQRDLDAAAATATAGSVDDELPMRRQFEDQLRRELDLSNREQREFALVSVMLDPFDEALAAHGERGRRLVQQAVTRLLRSNTRAMDASCRLDAERFAILLSGVGLATAHSRIEGLRRQCATELIVIDGVDLRFTVSMGVASYPHTAQDRDSLVQASDDALSRARQRGGNHVTLAAIRLAPG